MSFFDEADEPPATPRTEPRRRRPAGGGGAPPSRGGRRPPGDQQAIQVRRLIAAVAVVVVLILIIVGISSCQSNARISSLKDYASNVSSLLQQSDHNGSQLFSQLSGGAGANATALQSQINQTSATADSQLSHAKGLGVPDEMRQAQSNLILALRMRHDGIADIAQHIQPALGKSTNNDALTAMAADMARFYASDVLYKGYTTTQIAAALHGAGIVVGGADGVQIEAGQLLPDIQWLTPSFIAAKLGAQSQAPAGKPAPGTHGHSLDSVSVGGTTLQSGSTNTVPASPAPQFTLNLTNSGQNNEHNVICKVSISTTKATGQTTLPMTTAGQPTTCNVTLTSSPPPGSYTLTANIGAVPGEKSTANNTLTFPVTFK